MTGEDDEGTLPKIDCSNDHEEEDEGTLPKINCSNDHEVKQAGFCFNQTPVSMLVSPSETEKDVALQATLSKFEAYLLERRLMGT